MYTKKKKWSQNSAKTQPPSKVELFREKRLHPPSWHRFPKRLQGGAVLAPLFFLSVGFPLRDKIAGGYPIIIVKENRKYVSDKKQITYILTQNGIAIPVHFRYFRVYCSLITRNKFKCSLFILRHIPLIYWQPDFLLAHCQDYCRKVVAGIIN